MDTRQELARKMTLKVDTAIIGGGITGLYTCLQLWKQKGPAHRMALFESSNRLGGRIETVEMDGFLAEYGPMRFEKRAQPLLMDLIHELNLQTSHFPPYMAATDPESLYSLEEDDQWSPGGGSGVVLNALELLTLGILRVLQASGGDLNNPRDPRHWEWWAGLGESFYHELRTAATFRGEPLYKGGFWNILSSVLSHRALTKIINCGTFYHSIHQNPSAAECIIFWLRGLHPNETMVGIKEGTEALITKLAEKLSSLQPEPIPLYRNHKLMAIEEREGGYLRLALSALEGRIVTVYARHVVLALPRSPLRKLAMFFPEGIVHLVDSVIPIPLFKCFFVTKEPWWNQSTLPQTGASSVPTRELHYYYREEGAEKRGMVMVYGDSPSKHYWQGFVTEDPHAHVELNEDNRLRDYYGKYLSLAPYVAGRREREARANTLTCFGIRDFSREPFEAGVHLWKPGVQIEEAIRKLSAFPLSRARHTRNRLHICGEAYSDFQGFIEGGLRTALAVVQQIK
ncbi:MAG TPA: FAD-dependent oxidoreductase [Syntrophorhabdales bacterium]|nr:FAD-dependent oxidoreductase [Syntrophorhabdales bacterium]